MVTSELINELAKALSAAQGEMEGASKSAANPFFKSKYADLASVWDACRAPLAKYGLSIVQSPTTEPLTEGGAFVSVETRLLHSSGQWIGGTVSAAAKDGSPQAVGSCITYLKRYALQSFVGVAPEDDDGEAAQGRGNGPKLAQAALLQEPEGYKVWLAEMQGVMAQGIDPLKARWKVAPSIYRDYLSKDAKRWDGMKAAAQAVTDNAPERKSVAS